jgi:hypothetical protein
MAPAAQQPEPPLQQQPSLGRRRGLENLPDYRASDIAAKHIKRGLCLLLRHLPVLLPLPVAAAIW